MKIFRYLYLVVALLGIFSAVSCATQSQDAEGRNSLIGKWFMETGTRRTEVSNNADDTFSSRTTIDGKEAWTTSGEWWVKDGQLNGIYRKASIPDFPIGQVDASKLIEVTGDYYVIENRNGVVKKYQRVR